MSIKKGSYIMVAIIDNDIEKKVEAKDWDFDTCPRCKSDDIKSDFEEIEFDTFSLYRIHKCNKCGVKFEESYFINSIRVIEES
jgi:ribosomal protein L37AE/L43A